MRFFAAFLLFLLLSSSSFSQHTRIYACLLSNDSAQNFMGGSSLGSGLWKSDDTGKTWSQLGWKHVKCYSVAQSKDGKTLYQACGNGVLRSTSEGKLWKMMT